MPHELQPLSLVRRLADYAPDRLRAEILDLRGSRAGSPLHGNTDGGGLVGVRLRRNVDPSKQRAHGPLQLCGRVDVIRAATPSSRLDEDVRIETPHAKVPEGPDRLQV